MVSCDAPGSCLSGHNVLSLLLEPGHDLLLHLPLHRVKEEARVLQPPIHCASQPYKTSQADVSGHFVWCTVKEILSAAVLCEFLYTTSFRLRASLQLLSNHG